MRLRPATVADAPACASILNDWIDATNWMPRIHSPADVRHHYQNVVIPTRRVVVAEDPEGCAGFAAADAEMVTALYLRRTARGAGLGARLLDALRSGRRRLWTFVANAPARRFYAQQGFREVRRTDGDNEEGLPDILLERGP